MLEESISSQKVVFDAMLSYNLGNDQIPGSEPMTKLCRSV